MDEAKTNWPMVVLLWLAGLGAAGQYAKISVIFDLLPAVYPDAGAALGFVVSLVGAMGIVLGVIAGVLVARVGFRRAVLGGLILGAVLSGVQSLFPPLPVFLGFRILEGFSHLALVVAIPTMIAGITAEKDRGLALTLWGTFFGVAFAVMAWIGRPFAGAAGPGALLVAHGAYLAIMAAVLWSRLPRVTAQPGPFLNPVAAHLKIYRSPNIGAPAAGWLFYTFCFVSVLTVLPPFLPEGSRALTIGAMPLMSILSSMTLGVWMLRRVSAVSVIVVGFGACLASAIALILIPGAPFFAICLGAALGLVQGASFAAVPELNEAPGDRALANGGLAQMGNLGNTIGTPVMVTVIAYSGYSGMVLVLGGMLALGGVVHLGLARLRASGHS